MTGAERNAAGRFRGGSQADGEGGNVRAECSEWAAGLISGLPLGDGA